MDGEKEKNHPQETENVPHIEREGWDTKNIAEEGANESSDDVVRKVLRGDEKKESADRQDNAGSSAFRDTPQGREENKKSEGEKEQNG